MPIAPPPPPPHLELVRCLSPLSVNALSPHTPTAGGGKVLPAAARPCSVGRRARRRGAPEMSEVMPGLFVGSCAAACNAEALRREGITHVLNCTNLPSGGGCEGGGEGGSENRRYLALGLLDSTADLPRMPTVLADGVGFIGDALAAGGRVLVHCQRGISRSCTLAMAYMVKEQRREAEAVFTDVRRARSVCDPNVGYWVTLKEWEKQWLVPAATAACEVARAK